jgi:hydroxymethylpyrimidine pyrophosphatase-like HAD family hydrolase
VRWFRAVAVDLDGTLTTDGWPAETLLQRIDQVRADGLWMLLVTGRILAELDLEFPGLAAHFDVVVGENGCVLRTSDGARPLAEPVDAALLDRLHAAGLRVQRGAVLLATRAGADHVVLDAIESLGLDVQLVRNRNALMLLPAGVTKGTGLREALAELGVSPHNTLAVGDAENDHALLAAAGLGVAVPNAVESLRRRADLVLAERDGAGVSALLSGPVMTGEQRVPTRHRLALGTTADGRAATMPAAQTNLLVTGGSESGKSYLAGLLIEQLVGMGYVVLVVDPEGDHVPLGTLRGVTVLAGRQLPEPSVVPSLYGPAAGSLILDLSELGPEAQADYLNRLWPTVLGMREQTSLPHWLVVEEAQDIRLCRAPQPILASALEWGLCLVSYHPSEINQTLLDRMEWQVSLSEGASRQALLIPPDAEPVLFRAGVRTTRHVRHWHKYVDGELAEGLRFTFRSNESGGGERVGTLRAFIATLQTVPADAVRFHAGRGDFSRWLGEAYRDHVLASLVATAERDLTAHGDTERTRRLLVDLLSRRYLTPGRDGLDSR